jgi:hypothetical protein
MMRNVTRRAWLHPAPPSSFCVEGARSQEFVLDCVATLQRSPAELQKANSESGSEQILNLHFNHCLCTALLTQETMVGPGVKKRPRPRAVKVVLIILTLNTVEGFVRLS